MKLAVVALCLPLALAAPALAEDAAEPLIVVTGPGGAVDADEAGVVRADLINGGTRADLAAALAREVPGVSIAEAAGNPWLAAITWRGYGASALQGTEQGMAVYLDGARFNQPFGDTLALDLLPEGVIQTVVLRDASPIHGRNALGGTILLGTATGRERPGLELALNVDSFGAYGGSATWGRRDALIALDVLHDEGWRDASPSRLLRGFASLGHEGNGWGVGVKLLGADTMLTGNGVAPIELLDEDYDAIFTRPDVADSRYGRVQVLPWVALGESGRIEATIHYQKLFRTSANGDLADFGRCDTALGLLCLGEEDEGFAEILRDLSGAPVAVDPAVEDYAVFNRGRERTRGGGIGLQWLDERQTAIGMRRLAFGLAFENYRTRFGALSELGILTDEREVLALGTVLSSDEGGITSVDVVTRLKDFAVFGSAEIPLMPWLSVELGARWSHNRVELIDQIGTDLNGRHRFRRLSPSIEFDFEPSQGWRLSLGVSETSRNPTPAELSCADPEAPCALANFFVADPPLEQVVARNWHAGLANENGPFRGQLALWRSDSRNDIRHIASEVRGRAYFANLGRSRRQGVELSGEWSQGPWRLGLDYAFTDARFRSDFTVSSPANPAADDDDGEIEVDRGDRLPTVPRHAANIRAGYEGAGWGIEGAARLRSGQVLVGDEGNDNPSTPGYAIFDLRGRVALAPWLMLVGEVRNLFDRRYATFGTFSEIDEIELEEVPGAEDPRAYAPGMPRRFSIALKTRF